VFPTRRRVVRRTPAGPRLSGPTAVFLDYTSVLIASADDALGAHKRPPVLQTPRHENVTTRLPLQPQFTRFLGPEPSDRLEIHS
jgi:hypothetical protein